MVDALLLPVVLTLLRLAAIRLEVGVLGLDDAGPADVVVVDGVDGDGPVDGAKERSHCDQSCEKRIDSAA